MDVINRASRHLALSGGTAQELVEYCVAAQDSFSQGNGHMSEDPSEDRQAQPTPGAIDVTGVGYSCMDFLATVPGMPEIDTKTDIERWCLCPIKYLSIVSDNLNLTSG